MFFSESDEEIAAMVALGRYPVRFLGRYHSGAYDALEKGIVVPSKHDVLFVATTKPSKVFLH